MTDFEFPNPRWISFSIISLRFLKKIIIVGLAGRLYWARRKLKMMEIFLPSPPPFNGDGSELVCTTSSTALTVFVEVKRAALNIKFLHYFCHIARLFTLRLDSFSGDKNVQAITIGNGGCRAHTVNPKEWKPFSNHFMAGGC